MGHGIFQVDLAADGRVVHFLNVIDEFPRKLDSIAGKICQDCQQKRGMDKPVGGLG